MPHKKVRSVALVSPGWPAGYPPNGIVSYVARLRGGLEALNVRTHVLAWRVRPDTDDPAVRCINGTSSAANLMDRLRARLQLHLTNDQKQQCLRERHLSKAFKAFLAHNTVDVAEVPDSFGLSQALTPYRVPVVVRLHGPWFLIGAKLGLPQDASYHRRLDQERRAIEQAYAVSAPSQDVLDRTRNFYGLPLPNAEVIPNPIGAVTEDKQWRLDRCRRDHILYVGRFDRVKGGDIVIKAFGKVLATIPDATLVFAGPDNGFLDEHGRLHSLEDYLTEHLLNSEHRKRIQVLGTQTQDQIDPLRKQAQVAIVPSRYETFGITALEAMAAGCPLVASNTGGLAEFVTHDRNGLLFAPGDADALAEAILSLLQNPQHAAVLGRQAAEDVRDRYDPQLIARKTLEFYSGVLSRR